MTNDKTPIDLDPGIRHTVEWLQGLGFNTTDSGDGKTKIGIDEDALDFPHVFMVVKPSDLVGHAGHLMAYLRAIGIEVKPNGMDEKQPTIEATYDPADGSAIIGLFGVDDEMLARRQEVKATR